MILVLVLDLLTHSLLFDIDGGIKEGVLRQIVFELSKIQHSWCCIYTLLTSVCHSSFPIFRLSRHCPQYVGLHMSRDPILMVKLMRLMRHYVTEVAPPTNEADNGGRLGDLDPGLAAILSNLDEVQ